MTTSITIIQPPVEKQARFSVPIPHISLTSDMPDSTETIKRQSLKFRKRTPDAVQPVRGSKEAASFDLFSAEDGEIEPGKRLLVNTDLEIAIPPGYFFSCPLQPSES